MMPKTLKLYCLWKKIKSKLGPVFVVNGQQIIRSISKLLYSAGLLILVEQFYWATPNSAGLLILVQNICGYFMVFVDQSKMA